MVHADRSGVMFTAHPATGNRSLIVIEAAFGLGEVVVSGQVEPDTYIVAKHHLHLIDVRIGVTRPRDRARPGRAATRCCSSRLRRRAAGPQR